MTNILVTGITGLVGSSFVASLLKKDKELKVTAIVRRLAKKNALKRVLEIVEEQYNFDDDSGYAEHALDRINVIEGDITEPGFLDDVSQFKGVDTIFHCAADVNLGKDPEGKTYRINYGGTTSILELAKKLNVKTLHYVSTAYVSGKTEGLVKEDELSATEFNNPYEKSKFEAEKLVRASGIPFTIYRPSIIVGRLADGKIRKPLAFYRILEFMAKLKKHYCAKHMANPSDWFELPLRLKAELSDKIYFVPIDYVQKAVTSIFLKPVCNKTYHITGNSPVSTAMIEEVVGEVLKVKGVTVQPQIDDPSLDEKLVDRFIGDLLPYFSTQSIFDQTNVRAAVGEEALSWVIDKAQLKVLIGGYYKYFFPSVGWMQKL
ncbi:MAG: hypothetical protein A2020_02845 [Lentisphaerae bacterium GWF2_45_14]|nr:MAG: hypothetical protein A2020_02845 [Lentisphaerae bacterium GWF2_45_14]